MENGKSMITGFRYAAHMVEDGKRKKCIHCFPTSATVNLNWLSPELLEQVRINFFVIVCHSVTAIQLVVIIYFKLLQVSPIFNVSLYF